MEIGPGNNHKENDNFSVSLSPLVLGHICTVRTVLVFCGLGTERIEE